MLIIGLTGGIGSGKSTVAEMFADKQIPIIDTDLIARDVVEPGQPAYNEVISRFGTEILEADGTINRARLRRIVFTDEKQRIQLEAILHPAIRQAVRQAVAQLTTAYCIVVIPLLFETRHYEFIDRVLVVDCPPELQIKRAVQRDQLTVPEVKKILAAQVKREIRLDGADDIIVNDSDLAHLRTEVNRLHDLYLQIATRS